MRQNTSEKNLLWETLIEQVIEFELRGMDPLVAHVLLQLVIFKTKQKSKENLCEAMYRTFPYLG